MNKKFLIPLLIILIAIAVGAYAVGKIDTNPNLNLIEPSSPVVSSPIEKPVETPVTATSSQGSFTGEYVCLSHKDTSGPQTMECALGIKTDSGISYAMDTSGVPGGPFLNIPTGSRIEITGDVIPVETLNTDQWQKYNIKGIVRVSELHKI